MTGPKNCVISLTMRLHLLFLQSAEVVGYQ